MNIASAEIPQHVGDVRQGVGFIGSVGPVDGLHGLVRMDVMERDLPHAGRGLGGVRDQGGTSETGGGQAGLEESASVLGKHRTWLLWTVLDPPDGGLQHHAA